jgi:hypothetical protein
MDSFVMDTVAPWISTHAIDKSSPVTSLDQLHAQACLLLPVLTAKSLEVAGRHRGMMRKADRDKGRDRDRDRDREEGDAVQGRAAPRAREEALSGASPRDNAPAAQEASADGEDDFLPCSVASARLNPASIKSAMRCIEKADIVYKRDVSKLLDVCRQTIYFESMSDLNGCLVDLTRDPSIEIVRIKNTMSDDCDDDSHFAGFRSVLPPRACQALLRTRTLHLWFL